MKTIWGTVEGREIGVYTLENEQLRLEISDFGAIIRSLFVKSFQKDVVLGYDILADYVRDTKYLGATIGRCTNRIEKGRFILNGKPYQLALYNGPNHLHGGLLGFDKRVKDVLDQDESSIHLRYLSADMEENYPGNLDFSLSIKLVGHRVELEYRGLCDQDSPFNPTQHSYFNLSDEETIHNHSLRIDADFFAPVDPDGLSLYPPLPCHRAMDFKSPVLLGKRFIQNEPQFILAKGLDHHFIRDLQSANPFIELTYRDRCLRVSTSSPGAHVYSGNYLDSSPIGKAGFSNGFRSGICMETQFYPNNLINVAMPKGIVKAFEPMVLHTTWEFTRITEENHE